MSTISPTGGNLDVILLTKTSQDWRAFACWYSVQKNLPDARVFLICNRTTSVEFQYYQWAKRLGVKHIYTNPFCNEPIGDLLGNLVSADRFGFNSGTTLLLDYTTMVVDVLDDNWLNLLDRPGPRLAIDSHVAFAKDLSRGLIDSMINTFLFTGEFGDHAVSWESLCLEAKDAKEPTTIVGTTKGCGRWIDTMRGCPFSNADGLMSEDMTMNELRVVGLWRKMVGLYSTVN